MDGQTDGPTNRLEEFLFANKNIPVILAVKLPGAGEKDGSGGHVKPHGESFGGEQSLDESFAEQNLDRFFQNRQQTRMMNSDAAF